MYTMTGWEEDDKRKSTGDFGDWILTLKSVGRSRYADRKMTADGRAEAKASIE
jgi:hypothetical protein